VIEAETYNYSDCFTRFVDALCNRANFGEANAALEECEVELQRDFFLRDGAPAFLNKARQMLFEEQLRLHRQLSLASVAKQLRMGTSDAEVWLVNLIREAKIDAKVNSVDGVVHVAPPAQKSVWLTVQDLLDDADRPGEHLL